MGQQQLLLLVLGLVLVGLSVLVGIQAFSENQKKTNLDLMTNDAVRIASAVQVWKATPNALGGGASDANFTRTTFAQIGIAAESGTGDDAVYRTPNATFKVKPFTVSGQIAAYAQQAYGITDTGTALAIVGLSPDGTQSILIGIFMSEPNKTITILQHPYNTTVYNS